MYEFNEPEWPAEQPEDGCTCNQVLCLAGAAEWCAHCQAEYTAWLEEQADTLPMEFYVLNPLDVISLEATAERNAA